MKRRNTGSALILVMVSAVVLSILVGALFTLFQANTRSQSWAKERIQARMTAEAGMNMAVHMIMEGADVPQGDSARKFLPELDDWHYFGEEMGWVQIWVDPDNDNDQVASANAYEIRCLSRVLDEDQEYSYGISSLVLPRNFAVYATFLNSAGTGYFGDGYRFDGPFHTNTVVRLSSNTPGRDQDPWFYSISIVDDHYLYFNPASHAVEIASSPQHKNLFIEPYEKMVLGEPYFNLNADPIPFGSSEVNWQGAYNAALSGGLVLNSGQVPDGTRMILKSDTLMVRTAQDQPVSVYDLSALSEPVVWVNNNAGATVYLKTEEEYPDRDNGLPMGLTIGVNGSLAISGPLYYEDIDLTDPNNTDMLGLVIVNGDFLIAHDPEMSGDDDWIDPADSTDATWNISTHKSNYDDGIQVDAVIMVLDGYFQMEDWGSWPYNEWPHQAIDFEIVGGYIINEESVTTWGIGSDTWGYLTFVTYDPRLMSMHPPYFPQTGVWDTAYWEENPDMDENNIGDDLI